jgi:cytochrome c peroxidase
MWEKKPMNSRTVNASLRRALSAALFLMLSTAHAESPPAAASLSAADIPSTENAQPWFRPSYLHALHAPLPAMIYPLTTPVVVPKFELYPNKLGVGGNYQPAGPVKAANNAFFQSLGTNGRSCVTCHQPANALSVTPAFVQAVFAATGGKDPLFAPVDGANCPNQVPAANTSGALLGGRVGSASQTNLRAAYSQLLNKGLFRIFLPVPKQTNGSDPRPTEFTIEVVSDPNGCNTDPAYNQVVDPATGETTQIISVYRRPLITSNLIFKTTTLVDSPNSPFPPINPETREPLPIDPLTGRFVSFNLMWDSRDLTLQDQAVNAVLIHSQASSPPTSEQVTQMLAFQNGIFSAQEVLGPVVLSRGANGGSKYLSARSPSTVPGFPFDEFAAWTDLSPTNSTEERQASIARGQAIFNTSDFQFRIGNIVGRGCVTCHGQQGGGNEATPAGQRNTGVGGQSALSNGPSPDPTLPIFKLTCVLDAQLGNDGAVVMTNDPGRALITGRCSDIGGFTVPTIRAVASRAPYFHDGSAATVMDMVNFYDKRFSIGYTEQQKQDLANFLSAL